MPGNGPHALRRPCGHGRLLLLLACCGCAGPQLELAAPEGASVWLDGRQVAAGKRPIPYYGECEVDAFPRDAEDLDRTWSHTKVAMPEPVTPWLYPLDLPLELLRRVVAGPTTWQVRAELPPNPTPLVVGYQPTDSEPLRQRAKQARLQR